MNGHFLLRRLCPLPALLSYLASWGPWDGTSAAYFGLHKLLLFTDKGKILLTVVGERGVLSTPMPEGTALKLAQGICKTYATTGVQQWEANLSVTV